MTSDNSLKILLVEDSETDAILLRESVLSSGVKDISISVVQSLSEAKEHLKNNHSDAVLLDLTLPDSAGLNTVREVRGVSPDLPIVVLTGVEDENMGVEAVRAGVQDYLVKGQTDGRTITRVIRYSIERKNAEDAMLASELRYRRLFEAARDGILILDSESGRIVDVNPFIKEMLGYSHEELLNKKLWEVGLFKDVVESKEAFLKLQTSGYVRYENLPLETKDGRHIAVEFVSNVYAVDHTKVIQCNIRDITERKRIEDVLRFLAEFGSTTSGEDFFQSLARYLGQSLGMDFVCIDRLEENLLAAKTVAVYFDGKFEDNVSYTLKDTPCGDVVGKTICSFAKDVRRLFPNDKVLQDMKAESYIGTTLWSSQGKPIGLIAIIGRKPMTDTKLATSILQLAAVRAAGELERRHAEEALRKAHDELDMRVKERTAELGEMVMELQKQIVQRVHAEEASRSASLYARGLLEASLDPIVTINPQGKITDINRATELVTGVQRQNIIGSDFSDYFTEPQKAKDSYKKTLAKGMVKDYPLTIRHVSGHTTDVIYNATLYKNEAGQVQGVFAAARDVTEHNIMENRNRFTNVLLELFAKKTSRKEYLDSVVKAIYDWSGCQCVGIRIANSEGFIPYESHIGFSDEFVKEENKLCLKTDACICVRAIMQSPEQQDAPLLTHRGSFHSGNTFKFIDALTEKGKKLYRGVCMQYGFASLAVVPICYRDKVIGAIHLADKQENKTSAQTVEFIENMAVLIGEAVHRFDIETEFRESEERYRQLVELSPEGIGVERDDKIVFLNTAAVKMLGAKSSAELIGKSIFDFVHPDYRKRTHRQLEFLRRKQKSLPLRENKFVCLDGTIMDVEVAATPLVYEKGMAAQIVFRDITERKLAQERIIADQKHLRLLTAELLLTEERERHEIATALHDSLGPILAFSKRELGILQKSAPSPIAESLKYISENITEAIKQTRTLTFDLSPPTLYTLGFEIAIEELIERFCQEHKLEYSFRKSDEPKPLTDPVKVLLYRSIREILINIAKHAKAKLVKIALSRAEDNIEIAIEDDGKGFDASALIEKPKGLGLFSVRERLRHIGGKLEIASKRGKGTNIILTAPLKIE
jgi:PAS domain S-box-containing protein